MTASGNEETSGPIPTFSSSPQRDFVYEVLSERQDTQFAKIQTSLSRVSDALLHVLQNSNKRDTLVNGHEADHQFGHRHKVARTSVEDDSLDAGQGPSGCRPKSLGDFVTRTSVESDMGNDNQSDVDHADAVSISDPAGIEAGIADLLNGKHAEEQHGHEQNESQEQGQAHGDTDTVLANIFQKFSNLEEAGEPINNRLATIVSELWADKLSDDKLKDKLRKYPNPSNCNYMKVPKCNPEIWSGSCMNSNARSTGIALQKALSQVLRPSVATIKSCDQLTNSKSKEKKDILFKEMLVASIDSIAIWGQAIQDINQLRRDLI